MTRPDATIRAQIAEVHGIARHLFGVDYEEKIGHCRTILSMLMRDRGLTLEEALMDRLDANDNTFTQFSFMAAFRDLELAAHPEGVPA